MTEERKGRRGKAQSRRGRDVDKRCTWCLGEFVRGRGSAGGEEGVRASEDEAEGMAYELSLAGAARPPYSGGRPGRREAAKSDRAPRHWGGAK